VDSQKEHRKKSVVMGDKLVDIESVEEKESEGRDGREKTKKSKSKENRLAMGG
jgi:hypothetical protein